MWHCLDEINDISSFFASMYLCVTHHLLQLNVHRNDFFDISSSPNDERKRYLEYDISNNIALLYIHIQIS